MGCKLVLCDHMEILCVECLNFIQKKEVINMDRKQAISTIEALFPVDSQYEETNAIGERLLNQAKRECENWRNLPDAILFRYADLCEQEERRQCR